MAAGTSSFSSISASSGTTCSRTNRRTVARTSSSSTTSMPSGRLFEDVHGAGRSEADDVREADPSALDLPVARLPPQVGGDLPDVRDTGGRNRVALRLEAP